MNTGSYPPPKNNNNQQPLYPGQFPPPYGNPQPYPQQPMYYPPQQQPYFQPPPMMVQPQPPRRNTTCLVFAIIVAVFVVLGSFGIIMNIFESPRNSSTPTAQATYTPTPSRSSTWTTVKSFNGHLSEKTAFFTIQKRWRISWSCTNSDVAPGATGSFMAIAYDRTGHTISGDTLDPIAVSGECPVADAPTTGVGPVQKRGGTIYLDVSATGDWTIEVQVLK